MTLLCPECFHDQGLKKRIKEVRPNFPNIKCSFHPKYKGIPASEVAEIVDQVFRDNYGIGEIFPYEIEQRGDALEYLTSDLTQAEDEEIAQAVVNN